MSSPSAVSGEVADKGSSTKNHDWKSKAAAPGDWVSTLLRGKQGAASVLLEFRSGRNGAPMLVDCVEYRTWEGKSAYLSVAPMASELWEQAMEHRLTLSGARYDYRIKVLNEDELDGGHQATFESAWIELKEGEIGDSIEFDAGARASPELQLMSNMVVKLFSANVQLTRASGALVRQVTEGISAGLDAQFDSIQKMRVMAQETINLQMEMAKSEGDVEEVRELGKTARQWMQNSHEVTLAEKGVEAPDVPKNRVDAARGLYQSLNMGQLNKLRELMGEKFEMLVGLLEKSGKMTEQQIAQVFETQFGSADAQMELWGIAEKVFSQEFVPGTYAIWQSRAAHVLINGNDEKAA